MVYFCERVGVLAPMGAAFNYIDHEPGGSQHNDEENEVADLLKPWF
jgi:hypothetical protein